MGNAMQQLITLSRIKMGIDILLGLHEMLTVGFCYREEQEKGIALQLLCKDNVVSGKTSSNTCQEAFAIKQLQNRTKDNRLEMGIMLALVEMLTIVFYCREEEEKGNAMKQLENRTKDNRLEMDIMSALDEMQSLKARHERVDTDAALAALRRSAMEDEAAGQVDLDEEDEVVLREMLEQVSTAVY